MIHLLVVARAKFTCKNCIMTRMVAKRTNHNNKIISNGVVVCNIAVCVLFCEQLVTEKDQRQKKIFYIMNY